MRLRDDRAFLAPYGPPLFEPSVANRLNALYTLDFEINRHICETTGIPVESLTFVESRGTFQEADALVKDFFIRRIQSVVDAIAHRTYGEGLATILLHVFKLPLTVTASGIKAALLRLRQEMLYAALSAPRGPAGGRVG